MSTNSASITSYQLVFTSEVQRQWEQLPPRSRTSIHRELEAVARLVGQRQWVSTEEAEELFHLLSGPYELNYCLEPERRVLKVKGLRKAV